MFSEKNIALLKIQTQPGKRLSQFQTFTPLDKRINARLFRDPQFLYSPIFLSLSLSSGPGPGKVTVGPECTRKRTCARARTTAFLPPLSFWITMEHRGRDLSYIIPYDSLLRYLFLLPAVLHLLGGVLWNPLNRPL